MTRRSDDGATQPKVEAVSGLAASCLNTSRRTGSAGLLSKGRAKRATDSPIILVRGVGAGHEKRTTTSGHGRDLHVLGYDGWKIIIVGKPAELVVL